MWPQLKGRYTGHQINRYNHSANGGKRYTPYEDRSRLSGGRLNSILTVDSSGNLWFAVGEHLTRCDGKNFEWLTENGWHVPPARRQPGYSPITALHGDSRGNVWFATRREGLKQYDGVSLKTVSEVEGLESQEISNKPGHDSPTRNLPVRSGLLSGCELRSQNPVLPDQTLITGQKLVVGRVTVALIVRA